MAYFEIDVESGCAAAVERRGSGDWDFRGLFGGGRHTWGLVLVRKVVVMILGMQGWFCCWELGAECGGFVGRGRLERNGRREKKGGTAEWNL